MQDRRLGQTAFGADPSGYHAARPRYPEAVWTALRQRAGLRESIDILEIGAGTGIATGPLLAHRPRRLTAVESDERLARFLSASQPSPPLDLIVSPFEAAALPPAAYDLVVSATAFHWLDAVPALRRINTLLRPGGRVALWWNVFGDAERPDPFHDATMHLFSGAAEGTVDPAGRPAEPGLAADQWLSAFGEAGFTPHPPQVERWTLVLDPTAVRSLYASFSNVTTLQPDARDALLDRLADIAVNQFGGRVERNMTTAIYTAGLPDAASYPLC